MDYFGLNEHLAPLERQLEQTSGTERISHLVTLAWYLRQRDTQRALSLCDEAQGLLAGQPDDAMHRLKSFGERISLVRAEAAWLHGATTTSQNHLAEAQVGFQTLDDKLGLADCHHPEGQMLFASGRLREHDTAMEVAWFAGHAAQDDTRTTAATLRKAVSALNRDAKTGARDKAVAERALDSSHPGVQAIAGSYLAHLHYLNDDCSAAITVLTRAFPQACDAGQIRFAIYMASNIAANYCSLCDYAAGLEWMERGLRMARESAWPLPLGWSLAQTAQVLRLTGRLDAARELLDEAMTVLEPYQGGRDYFSACISLGHLLIDLGDHRQALERLVEAEQLARTIGFPDLVADSLRGQALALSGLGRGDEAMAAGQHALELAQSQRNGPSMIEPLRTLALIARQHRIMPPKRSRAASAPIHYLELALRFAIEIDGYGVPHELYAELSRDYEAVGDWRRALYFERQAVESRENELAKRARDLALAIEIRYKTDKAMAAAEHHKALAALESQRAHTLEASRDTLALLATIGQEITAKLDPEAVFLALHRHVGALLDAPSLAIFVLEEDCLALRFGIEDGRPMPALALSLDDPISNAVRCVHERQLLALQLQPDDPTLIPGTRPMPSALFAPLIADDVVLGVLSIQSARGNAYAERERQILRMLAAYGAVALANAAGAQQLAAARAELERQKMRNLLVHAGKLATVGRLASGLIHELSHPVGAIGLSLGTLKTLLDIGESDKARELVPEVSHEVARLRTLIQRLRNMARSDPPRIGVHQLSMVLRDARQMFGPRLVTEGVIYDEAVEPHEVKADAELLSLAIANVVANAADAMAEGPIKRIEVRTVREGNWVHLAIVDSGPGMSPQTEQNLFKPFYTTKPEDKGLGLGLALSAEYLAAMGARIQGGNAQRGGAEFRIALPLADPTEPR